MRLATILFFICASLAAPALAEESQPTPYAGATSCRECHEKFYQLWSTSMHGQAMQPYTPEFAKARLTPQKDAVTINKLKYRADVDKGVVIEAGAKGTKSYRIEHVLGGKNVFYFLTSLDKGRLQTLPLAFDVNKKEWFDTAASGLRHFPGGERSAAVDWKDYQYTFNTACYGCHVSQISTNYDPKTDTYHTTWTEPGINCETCHGSALAHNEIAKATPKDKPLTDLRIIRTKTMTKAQRNDLCSSCHAKASPLTPRVPARGAVLRPLRPRDARGRRLLPRRPRPGGELHLHLLEHEPLRQVREVRLHALPHLERPLPLQEGEVQQRLRPLPRGQGERPGGAHAPPRGGRGEQVHLLPHAEDRVRADEPERSLDGPAGAGGDHRVPVAERLQRLPRRQGRGVGRRARAAVAHPGLPGAGPRARRARRRRPQAGLDASCRRCSRTSRTPSATKSSRPR